MVKAVEDIGGASKLTEKELARLGATTNEAVEKMKALGMEVPQNLQKIADQTKGATKATKDWAGSLTGIAGSITKIAGALGLGFSIKGAIDFGKALLDDAGHIADLSAKLGVSTDAVQRWTYAVGQTGGSMDTVNTAVSTLNRTMGDGSTSTRALLKDIGLSFETLRHMQPEDAFESVVAAVAKIKDPIYQADVAVKLFGKSGQDMLPSIRQGFLDVAAAADVVGAKQIEAMDRLGDQIDRAASRMKARAMEIMGALATGANFAYDLETIAKDVQKQYNMSYRDAYQYVAKLTEAERDAYLQHLKDVEVAKAQAAQSKAVVDGQTAHITKTAEEIAAEKKAADAAAAHAEKIKDLAASLSGVNLTQRVKDLTEAVELNRKAMGDAALKTQAVIDEVLALGKQGAALTGVLKTIYDAHKNWAAITVLTQKSVKSFLDDLPTATRAVGQYNKALLAIPDAADLKLVGSTFLSSLPNIGPQVTAWGNANIRDSIKQTVDETNAAIGLVGTVFNSLGQQGGAAWKAAMQLSEIAVDGMIRYQNAITDADRETVKIPTTTAIATTVMSLGIDYMIAKWSEARSQMNDAQSTIAGLQAQITALGGVPVGGPIVTDPNQNPYLDTSLVAKLQQQIRNLQQEQENARKAQDELNAAIQKYGLTFKDLDQGPVQKLAIIRDAFLHTANALIFNGYQVSSVIHGMRDDLNEVVRTALETRQTLPETFRPFLEDMARSGDLADDVKRKLLGLADPAPWEDMKTAAEKYGIALGDLGPAFQQSKLDSMSKDLLADWTLLVTNGANVNAVIEGMSGKVNDLVHDSLQFGVDIPANMKPMLEAMAAAGKLTDENGDKLTDLSKLHFAADLAADFDKLILKLDELITKLTGGGGGAHPNSVAGAAESTAAQIEASFNNVTINPIHVPYVFDAANPPDFDVDAAARAPHLARGGIVTRPTFAVIGEAGPEAVVPLGAGGALPTSAPILITVISQLDGREVARNQVRYIPNELRAAGV